MKKVSIHVYLYQLIEHYKPPVNDSIILKAQCENIYNKLLQNNTKNLSLSILKQCLLETSTLSTLLSTIRLHGVDSIEDYLIDEIKKSNIEILFTGSANSYHETIQLITILNQKRNDHKRSKRIYTGSN